MEANNNVIKAKREERKIRFPEVEKPIRRNALCI
jgi:hypothetical protein